MGVGRAAIFGADVPADANLDELESRIRERLAVYRAALVTGFAPDPNRYIDLLRRFGDPLPNYGGTTPDLPAYSLHANINVVKLTDDEDARRLQAQGGPLAVHSARAFSETRPNFIAMYMANPGWVDAEPGQRGESIVVRWRDVLAYMRRHAPATYAEDLAILSETPLAIVAQFVRDNWSILPLLYPPPDPDGPNDVAARLPPRFAEDWTGVSLPDQISPRYQELAAAFVATANDPEVLRRYQLAVGEFVLLDNNRYGHGRCNFVRTRPLADGNVAINPRELWSVVIA
jgi:hypothetical protein